MGATFVSDHNGKPTVGDTHRAPIWLLAATLGFHLAACSKQDGPKERIFASQAAAAPAQKPEGTPPEEVTVPAPAPNGEKTEVPAPPGFERVDVVGIAPTEAGHAVVLTGAERALTIFVGETEGLSIQLRLGGQRFHRPLTHDLLDSVIASTGAKLESVRVDRFDDEIFHGVVVLKIRGKSTELDARSSDAIALAIGNEVPIFVRESVLERAGISLDLLPPYEEHPPLGTPGEPDPSLPGQHAPGVSPPPASPRDTVPL